MDALESAGLSNLQEKYHNGATPQLLLLTKRGVQLSVVIDRLQKKGAGNECNSMWATDSENFAKRPTDAASWKYQ
jgi:uncharacterized protein YccT (UPF0319 family)